MQKHKPTPRSLYQKRLIGRILMLLIFTGISAACNSYRGNESIRHIAPPGKPAVQSIIWSPVDANQVLVTSNDLEHHDNQVYILNISTREKNILEKTDKGTLVGLGWSPDGKQVLFMRTTGIAGVKSQTVMVNKNGNSEEVLVEAAVDAAWSPDGKTVVFFSYDPKINGDLREIHLHLLDIDSSHDATLLTLRAENSFGLSWSPDGKRLVFALGNRESSNLFVLSIDDQEYIQITEGEINHNPVWSPQDNIIAYHTYSSDGLSSSLSLIRPDGNCKVEIPNLERAWSPTWLPAGKTLGFVGLDGIYTIDLNKVFERKTNEGNCPQTQ